MPIFQALVYHNHPRELVEGCLDQGGRPSITETNEGPDLEFPSSAS
jgi:hypothetical protein